MRFHPTSWEWPALQDCETQVLCWFLWHLWGCHCISQGSFYVLHLILPLWKANATLLLAPAIIAAVGISYVSRLHSSSPLWLEPFHFTKFLLGFLRRAIALPCSLLTRNALPYMMQYGFSLDKCKKNLCAIMRLWELFSTNLPLKAYYTSTIKWKNSRSLFGICRISMYRTQYPYLCVIKEKEIFRLRIWVKILDQ